MGENDVSQQTTGPAGPEEDLVDAGELFLEQDKGTASGSDEGVIELTDVVETSGQAVEPESESAEIASPEEEEILELVDAVDGEPQEEIVELTDMVSEGPGDQAGDHVDESPELPSDSGEEPDVMAGISDEKLEAMVTKAVKQIIGEKAERILLEVAEAAVAKEIDKIKKAL